MKKKLKWFRLSYVLGIILFFLGYYFLGHVHLEDNLLGELSAYFIEERAKAFINYGYISFIVGLLLSFDLIDLILGLFRTKRISKPVKLLFLVSVGFYLLSFSFKPYAFMIYLYVLLMVTYTLYALITKAVNLVYVIFLVVMLSMRHNYDHMFFDHQHYLNTSLVILAVIIGLIYLVARMIVKHRDKQTFTDELGTFVQGVFLLGFYFLIETMIKINYSSLVGVIHVFYEPHWVYQLLFFIGVFALSVITYSFGLFDTKKTELLFDKKRFVAELKRFLAFIKGFKFEAVFLIVTALIGILMMYTFVSITLTQQEKLDDIKGLEDNIVILDRYAFFEHQSTLSLSDSYEVSYIDQNVDGIGNGINLNVVSDNYFDSGVIYKTGVHDYYFNVQETQVLYESKNVNPTNPIIIDETAAIKLFNQKNAVGKTVELWIEGKIVEFNVYKVIRETNERLHVIEYLKTRGHNNIEAQIDFSQAYIFISDYENLIGSKSDISLMKLTFEKPVSASDLDQIIEIVGIDKATSVHSHRQYLEGIKQDYQTSVLNNLVILLMVVFLYMIYLYLYTNKRFKQVKGQNYIESLRNYINQNRSRVLFSFLVSNGLLAIYFYVRFGFFFLINAYIYLFILTLMTVIYVLLFGLSSFLVYKKNIEH